MTAFLGRRKHKLLVKTKRVVTLHYWLYFIFPLLPPLLIFAHSLPEQGPIWFWAYVIFWAE